MTRLAICSAAIIVFESLPTALRSSRAPEACILRGAWVIRWFLAREPAPRRPVPPTFALSISRSVEPQGAARGGGAGLRTRAPAASEGGRGGRASGARARVAGAWVTRTLAARGRVEVLGQGTGGVLGVLPLGLRRIRGVERHAARKTEGIRGTPA